MLKSRLLAASALAAGVILVPAAAWAQDTTTNVSGTPGAGPSNAEAVPEKVAAANADAEEGDSQAIVVTGSRIRSPNLTSSVPITTIGGEELFETGKVSVGDVLNELPALRSTFSQANSTRFLGTRGLNLLDLRGLNTQRTLVLVNGRRHVAADLLNNAVSPDINTFPTDLIERVDIITGGASSVYGSDAIAGVVNFITKDHYDGIQLRGQGGVSTYGDAGNYYVSALAGKNFAEDRGNIAVNLEYTKADRYYASGRPTIRQNNNFVVVDTDPAGSVNGSDGNPDRLFFRDIRSATISLGGRFSLRQPNNATARCGRDSLGNAFSCGFLFQPDGSLVAQTGDRVGLNPNGNYIGGNGYSGREGQLLALTPSLEKIAVNLLGHFEISPAFVPFFEAKYVRSDAFGSQSGPFFSQGTTLGDPGGRERVRLDNPYLGTAARTLIAQQILAGGIDPNSTAATPPALTAAQINNINNGSFRINLQRNWLDLGIRDEKFRRETYRAVAGVRGTFNDDWSYEVSANYGEHHEKNVIQGNVNVQRYLLALDTTRDANGNIVCRSKLNPTTTVAYVDDTGNPNLNAQTILANDIAACQPLNPFGERTSTQAARDYIVQDTLASGKITQFDALAFLSGDLSKMFELPGGPVGFSVGAEYRRETARYDLDDFTQAGYAFYNAIPTFDAPSFEVKEAFGEIQIPVLKDVAFFKELTLKGSGRISDYKGATGTVYTYGGSVDYAPIQDIRFRAAYNRAVRAPNLVDLYSVPGQNFAPAPNDPCSARNIATGSSTRAANCAAAGIPTTYDFVYTSSIEIVSGGNPALREEKSDSYTAGVVITPRWVPGLSLSVDYYDIKVDNVITAPTAQEIINACYDAATINNQFCALFTRNGPTTAATGEAPFQILQGSLQQQTLNYAKLTARGVDTEAAYRHTFDWGTVGFRALWTRVLERNDYLNPADPNRANVRRAELGYAKDRVNVDADVKFGGLTLGYQLRWIDKMYLNTFEDFNSVQGRPPENADYASRSVYPDVWYHDARVGYDVNDRFNIYLGVDNFTNRLPPLGLTGIGDGSGIYDIRGRYIYTGVVAKF